MARNFHVQERDELLRRIEARDQMIADLGEEIERLKAKAAPEPVQWSGFDDETLPPGAKIALTKDGRSVGQAWIGDPVLIYYGGRWITSGEAMNHIESGEWWRRLPTDPPPEN